MNAETRAFDLQGWRRERRSALIAERVALSAEERNKASHAVAELVRAHVPELARATIGFYWPFRAEIDLRPLVRACIAQGARAALPVVVEKRAPLEFRSWRPGIKMEAGVWNIPVPADRHLAVPDVVLSPLVGFDPAGFRLGYGGGFYDRTLAAMRPRPLVIGVGHDHGALATIHPRWHDIPMDAIVTASGIRWPCRRGDEGGFASPPCSMHELDASWMGYLGNGELERELAALVQTCRRLTNEVRPSGIPHALAACTAAIRALVRLEACPPAPCGEDALVYSCHNGAAIAPLLCDAGELRDRVRALLPRVGDDAVHDALAPMVEHLHALTLG